MSAETLVKLIEELVDLKVQQQLAGHLKLSPELAQVVARKREADRQRLEEVRRELIEFLSGQPL